MDEQFYILMSAGATQYYHVTLPGDIPDEYYTGMHGFKGPLVLEVMKGKKASDYLSITVPGIHVVSGRLLNVLQENDFQKYDTYPVVIHGASEDMSGYRGLRILGKGGHYLPEESGAIYSEPDPATGYKALMRQERLAFDINGWDGSDLFVLPEYPNLILVTARVRLVFKKTKLTNCGFTPTSEDSFG